MKQYSKHLVATIAATTLSSHAGDTFQSDSPPVSPIPAVSAAIASSASSVLDKTPLQVASKKGTLGDTHKNIWMYGAGALGVLGISGWLLLTRRIRNKQNEWREATLNPPSDGGVSIVPFQGVKTQGSETVIAGTGLLEEMKVVPSTQVMEQDTFIDENSELHNPSETESLGTIGTDSKSFVPQSNSDTPPGENASSPRRIGSALIQSDFQGSGLSLEEKIVGIGTFIDEKKYNTAASEIHRLLVNGCGEYTGIVCGIFFENYEHITNNFLYGVVYGILRQGLLDESQKDLLERVRILGQYREPQNHIYDSMENPILYKKNPVSYENLPSMENVKNFPDLSRLHEVDRTSHEFGGLFVATLSSGKELDGGYPDAGENPFASKKERDMKAALDGLLGTLKSIRPDTKRPKLGELAPGFERLMFGQFSWEKGEIIHSTKGINTFFLDCGETNKKPFIVNFYGNENEVYPIMNGRLENVIQGWIEYEHETDFLTTGLGEGTLIDKISAIVIHVNLLKSNRTLDMLMGKIELNQEYFRNKFPED